MHTVPQPGTGNRRQGAAAVEFALLMPVFLLVVWGIVEFGRAMMVGQLVTNASRHGARLAILEGATNSGVKAEIDTFLQNAVSSSLSGSDIQVTYEVLRNGSLVGDDLMLAAPKDHVVVQVQVDYSRVNLVPIRWLSGARLTGRCAMRHE